MLLAFQARGALERKVAVNPTTGPKVIGTILAMVFLCCCAAPAHAEIEKVAIVCDIGLCFHWWPKVPQLDGWHHDNEQSIRESINALVPDGSTFVDAEIVMYAKASYKPRMPEIKTLDQLIEHDLNQFSQADKEEAGSLVTADGQVIRTFLFNSPTDGAWERVGYGEEDDFYLVFVVSSHSQKGRDDAEKDFERLVGQYRKNP